MKSSAANLKFQGVACCPISKLRPRDHPDVSANCTDVEFFASRERQSQRNTLGVSGSAPLKNTHTCNHICGVSAAESLQCTYSGYWYCGVPAYGSLKEDPSLGRIEHACADYHSRPAGLLPLSQQPAARIRGFPAGVVASESTTCGSWASCRGCCL